ncbi:flippase [Lacrimispora sp.]|uniref:lipopolysaccharide biosynthesis protein n=1 Tax=Lacrimispora sp. TaxID=2719234 RepID=UPI0032E3C91F
MRSLFNILKNNKEYNIPLPVRASIWFTICSIMQKGIVLLTTPIFTRLLTTDQYGVYTIYQSWYQIIAIFATLNMYMGVYNNGVTKFPNDKNRYTSTLLGLSTVITVLIFIVFAININWWSDLLDLTPLLLGALFVQLLFDTAFQYWAAFQRYSYNYRPLVGVTIIIAIISPLLGIILVLISSHKAEARILSFLIVQSCVGIICYIYIMVKGRRFYLRKYWKYALVFSLPLIPHYLSGTILNQADRLMIASMVGKSEAAIYSVAYTVAMMMTVITNAINSSFIPYSFKELKRNSYQRIRKSSEFLLLLVAILCILAMIFCPEIISVFASEEYSDAIWVMPPIAASVFFMFLYTLFGNIEFYYEKTKFVAISSCLSAVINIILNSIFIRIYGYYAAGYTTLVCYILYSLMHYLFYKKIIMQKTTMKGIYNERLIFLLSLVILVIMLCMTFLYKYTVIRYCSLLILIISFIHWRKEIIEKVKEIKTMT